jgi:hypothetical protein
LNTGGEAGQGDVGLTVVGSARHTCPVIRAAWALGILGIRAMVRMRSGINSKKRCLFKQTAALIGVIRVFGCIKFILGRTGTLRRLDGIFGYNKNPLVSEKQR